MLIKHHDGTYVYLKDSDVRYVFYDPGTGDITIDLFSRDRYKVSCTPEEAEGATMKLERRMAARGGEGNHERSE